MKSREHWERVHRHIAPAELSWFQREPTGSLDLIRRVAPDLDAPIIDVGGGASTLVDVLLDSGYSDLTVLDVSIGALRLARERLGERAASVRWIAGDVRAIPIVSGTYAVWHDRAVFHFLTDPHDRVAYVDSVRAVVRPGGRVIVASFALDGPTRCSGLPVVRYSCESMYHELGATFRLLDDVREVHHTPKGATQPFVYCLWRLDT